MTNIPSSEAPNESIMTLRTFFGCVLGIIGLAIAGLTWMAWSYNEGWWGAAVAAAFILAAVIVGSPTKQTAAHRPPSQPQTEESKRFWFWSILVGGVTGIAFLNGFESDGVAGFGSLVVIAAGTFMLSQLANVNVFRYVRTNLVRMAVYTAVYLSVGLLYAGVRYGVYTHDWRQDFNAAQAQYETMAYESLKNGEGNVPEWKESSNYKYLIATLPEFQNSKSLIARWTAFWPWSGAYFLLSDFVARAFEWLIDQFGGIFDLIGSRYTHDLK